MKESGLPLIYVNQVGGQDELVFEGASFVLNSDASLAAQLPAFTESVALTHWERARVRMALRESADRQARRGRQGRLRDLRAGPARLCREERFQGRGARACPAASIRPLRRHRRRCARRRARARGDAALQIHLAGIARRRGSGRESARHPLRHRADRKRRARFGKSAGADVRQSAARRDRREFAGARARHHPDGHVQQVRA